MQFIDLIFPARARSRAQFLSTLSPVVVMGRGHSGTRILSFICRHLGINLGAEEEASAGDVSDRAFQKQIKHIALRSLGVTRIEQVPPAELSRFRHAVFNYYDNLGRPSTPWGWKFPETYLMGPCVAATFPKVRILHMLRDGRDVAFKEHLTDNPRKKLGRAVLGTRKALGQPRHLQAAQSWAFQVEHFEAFQANFPKEQIFNLTFEELCTRPEETAQKVCGFLNMPMTEACANYIKDGIDPRKVSQYRKADPGLVREVEQRVGSILQRYGYLARSA
jgi:hypothetical protein